MTMIEPAGDKRTAEPATESRITLYHCWSARSFRALWTLEELQLGYRLELLPFPPRFLAPGYLAVNPLGTIPLLLDGDVRMTESAAICQYLAAKYGPTPLAVTPDEPGFAPYLNFLHMGEATLTFPQTIHLRYAVFARPEDRLPRAAEDYVKWFLARLRAATKLLGDNDYLTAGRFTVADISVGYALKLAKSLGFAGDFPEPWVRYLERLEARDGYQRALGAEKNAPTVPLTP